MKVAVVGGVASTEVLLRALVRHQIGEIAVWGYEPSDTSLVSGWRDLRCISEGLSLAYMGFRKVTECEASLRSFAPDIMFVVGLSQIVPSSMLGIAEKRSYGFHPTALPRGRGRAALAWLILQGENGAATFFELRNGVDDGPISAQEPYDVAESDDAADVEAKLLEAERAALDNWLPRLASGDISSKEQEHSAASWLGRRAPADGWLNWQLGSDELLRLIRASAPPHPGAFTYCEGHKILILRATYSDRPEKGVLGRILAVHEMGDFEVQAADSIVHVTDWAVDSDWKPRVGALLGYYVESEIFDLRQRVERLEASLEIVTASVDKENR
jgi:methionyl-tRNA formyltransferase